MCKQHVTVSVPQLLARAVANLEAMVPERLPNFLVVCADVLVPSRGRHTPHNSLFNNAFALGADVFLVLKGNFFFSKDFKE